MSTVSTVSTINRATRYYTQDIFDRYYSELAELENKNNAVYEIRSKCVFLPTDYLFRADLFRPKIFSVGGVGGVGEGEDVGLGGISSYEYESLVFLCLDILELFYSYSIIEKSIAFRKNYLHSFVVKNNVRRELCLDYIFRKLHICCSIYKKIMKSLSSRRKIYFENYLADVYFMSTPLLHIESTCHSIYSKTVDVLFYKEIYLLKILACKFDLLIVDCISWYLIGRGW